MSDFPDLRPIYVVDQNVSVALTLVRILHHSGYDATPFTDPFEALQAACATAPALLLVEADATPLSGIDLAVEVRKRAPDCKVLLLSEGLAVLEVPQAWGDGRSDFEVLEKPLGMSDLVGKVQGMIRETRPPQSTRFFILEDCCA